MTRRFAFELEENIGVVGYGERWLARSKAGQDLEVWLFDNTQGHIKEAIREIRAAKPILEPLDHPNIQSVLKIGRRGKQYYMAMARMRGRPLLEALRKAPITTDTLERGLEMASEVCSALAFLNEHCHPTSGRGLRRDRGIIAPDRIWLDEGGNLAWGDFGLPVVRRGARPASVVDLGYCAPDIFMSDPSQVDSKADVHALAILIYEMISGHRPYSERRLGQPLKKGEPIDVRQRAHWIPEDVAQVIMRAFEPGGYERPGAFGLALDRCRRRLVRGGDGLMTFDEVLPWLRARVYEDNLPSIAALLWARGDLAAVGVVSDYVWSHFGERLLAPLHQDRPLPEPWQRVLERLPAAIPALESVVLDEGSGEESRVTAAKLLAKLEAREASEVLIEAMNTSSRRVAQAAAEAVESFDGDKPLRLDGPQARIVPCSLSWAELEPIASEGGCEQRHCGTCDHVVVRVRDVASLAALGEGACAFFEPPEPAEGLELVMDSRQVRRLEPGRTFNIGPWMTLGDPGHEVLAEVEALEGDLLCIRACDGAVFVDGVRVTEAIIDTRVPKKVEAGTIEFSVAGPKRVRAKGLRPWRQRVRMGRIAMPRFG